MEFLSTMYVKKGDNPTVDTYRTFGFATGDFAFPSKMTPKEFAARSVPGEDGERVFFPDKAPLEAYDLAVEFKYQGALSGYYERYKEFMGFLRGADGGGTNLSIYSPWHRTGRKDVYVKNADDPVFQRNGDECHISVKVTFRVTNPVEDVVVIPESELD